MVKDVFLRLRRKSTHRDHVIFVIAPPEHERLIGAAEAPHRFYQRVEHRLEVDRGVADDLEYVSGRGLLLQWLLEVAGARLHFIKQSHVLDRDDGLIGKRLHQLNLLISKWLYFIAPKRDRANGLALPEQRNGQGCSVTKVTRHPAPIGELVDGCLKVVNVDWDAVNKGASGDPPPSDRPFIELQFPILMIYRSRRPIIR